MAIATKKIAAGTLALADVNSYPSAGFTPISNSSDWFESRLADGATRFTVSLIVNALTASAPTASERLTIAVLESDDLVRWTLVTTLSLSPSPPTIPGLYKAEHTYAGPPKKYFRLQFHIDDPSVTGFAQTMPWPDAATTIQYDGACWVTVANAD